MNHRGTPTPGRLPRSVRAAGARLLGRGTGWTGLRDRVLVSLIAVPLVASIGAAGTWAAWKADDDNANNTFTSSTILISDNQGGQAGSSNTTGVAMFTVTNLSPSSPATTKCIGVDFTGSSPTMTLAATLGGTDKTLLESQLTMDVATYNTTGTTNVTPGTNTNNGGCGSYPATGLNTTAGTQGATLAAWAGAGPYTIAAPVTRTWYKFTVSGLPATASNCPTYCNKTITIKLTWSLTAA